MNKRDYHYRVWLPGQHLLQAIKRMMGVGKCKHASLSSVERIKVYWSSMRLSKVSRS